MTRDRTPADGAGVYTAWKEFGTTTHPVENPLVTAVATSATKVLNNNPNRIAIIISVVAANNVYFGLNKNIASGGGMLLTNAMPPMTLTVKDYGEIVTAEWWGIADVGATNVYVTEVVGEG